MQVHYLSGPINVKDAEGKLAQPGDLLAVELCNLGPMPGQRLGPPVIVTIVNMPAIASQMTSSV
jgi:acetamidase/formamidase